LGNVPLSDVTFVSSTTLTATLPADLPGGAYTLTVTNPDSQSTGLVDGFTVLHSGNGNLGPWEATTSMIVVRDWPAAVQAGSCLYVLGGGYPYWSNPYHSVEWAPIGSNGSLGSWQETSPMTTARSVFAAVQIGSYLYALGGRGGGSSVERAAINTDGSLEPWQATTSMATARPGLAAVVTNGYIYAIGGEGTNSVERAVVNPGGSLGTWQAAGSMTKERGFLAAVAVGNYIYAIGGQNHDPGGVSLESVERAAINPDGYLGPWEAVASMTVPRCNLAAVAAGGYIYAVGGGNCTGTVYSSVERAKVNPDGSLGPWEAVASMSTPRFRMAAVRAGSYVYAIGGEDHNYTMLSSVERAEISFDITAPTADGLTINGGALNSTSTTISVTLSASDADSGLAGISFSNDGTTWGDWQDYSTHASWSLSTGDGLKTVYSRVRDSVGYVSSIVSDTISLDTTAPAEHGLSINDGALYTNKVTVTLTIGAQPGTAQMQVSNEGNFAGAEWEPYASRKSWQVTQYLDYVIPRLVYVRYKDVSGNVSSTYLDD